MRPEEAIATESPPSDIPPDPDTSMDRATTERAAAASRPSPSLTPDDESRFARLRDECLRSLVKRYCAIFVAVAFPAFLLLVASEGEAIPIVAPAFVVVTGLLAALVTERSEPGRRLRELDSYLKGESAAAPATPIEPVSRPFDARSGLPPGAGRGIEIEEPPPAPPLLLRAFYFLVIGWWLSIVWVHLAWLLSLVLVGIPAGRAMFEQLPVVMSLSPAKPELPPPPMRARVPLPISAIYFLGVGSWLSLVVAELGWVLSILPMPRRVGMSCLRAVPYVLTLRAR